MIDKKKEWMSLLFLICTSKQVINTNIVVVGQFYKYFYGNIDFPQFVFGIGRLFYVEIIRQFLLSLIVVFSEVSDVLEYHAQCSFLLCLKLTFTSTSIKSRSLTIEK